MWTWLFLFFANLTNGKGNNSVFLIFLILTPVLLNPSLLEKKKKTEKALWESATQYDTIKGAPTVFSVYTKFTFLSSGSFPSKLAELPMNA